MTSPLTALTCASVAYEASSLLNTYPGLPQPDYITVQMHRNTGAEHASIRFVLDEPEQVKAWAVQFSTEVTEIRVADHAYPGTDHHTVFTSPWDPRVRIHAACFVRP